MVFYLLCFVFNLGEFLLGEESAMVRGRYGGEGLEEVYHCESGL